MRGLFGCSSRLLASTTLLALASAVHAADGATAPATFVWVEGENPTHGQGYPHPWYSEQIQRGLLSGNAFLSSFTDQADTEVDYDVDMPAAGDYTLWARVNPIAAAIDWRQGTGAWTPVDLSKTIDQVNIASDGKPDMRFLAWVKVATVTLPAGKASIGFKLHSANNHHGALDCFVLTTKPFLPSGKNQPAGAKPAAGFDATSYVWVEGEAATSSDFKPHNWYSDAVKKDMLSEGNWLTTFDGPEKATAHYDIALPKDAAWTLWLRANPIQAGLEWQIDGGEWRTVDVAHPQDQINLANDGKPDLRFIAWMNGGKADLKAGTHQLAVRTTSKVSHHAGIDVLLFAAKPFAPNGKVKPGSSLGEADPGFFAFEPGQDAFTPDALLDLRGLNEKRAGEQGWVAAKGDDFVLPNGTPLRLWAVNASNHESPEAAQYLFARLAKTGVNASRFHGLLADRKGNDPLAISKEALDQIHYNVKAAADQGIYVYLSTYFPLWMQLKPSDGIEGCALGKNPFGLLLFEPKFQALYKAWAKQVLTTRNPYTGKTLAEDPAVAFWEIENEDSLFFWTMKKEAIGPGPYRTLCGQFATWAAARYGSVDKALATWGESHPDDNAGGKLLGLYDPWPLTKGGFAQSSPAKRLRITDQVRFYAETMRNSYADITAFLRKDCGFKGMVTGSNWTTADNKQLGAIERWTYGPTDVIDRHGYFGGKHEGDGSGWSVRAGHTYSDLAAVLDPAETPLGYLQLAGHPHIHTEIAWNKPNRFTADGVLLTASYAALQGVDGFFQFAANQGTWASEGTGVWPMIMPGSMGQWPAAALQFRRGDLTPAPAVVRQVVSTEDMFAFKGSGLIEGKNADFRATEAPKAAEAGNDTAFDPLSYYVGRVERVITGMPGAPSGAKPVAQDLSKQIDRAGKVVTSITGELRWDWGNGVVTVDSAKSQAATGFLAKGGTIKLGEVTIRSGNEYGAIQVIALDGQPLASSKKILIQAFTEEHMYGFRTDHGKILDTGRAPINVREIDAQVTFAHGAGLKAVALDGHGYAAGDVPVAGGVITLPKDRLYVIVTR